MRALVGLSRRATADAAVSWPAFCVALVASLVLYLSDTLDVLTLRDLPLRIAMVAVAAAGMFGVMALMRRLPYVRARGDRFRWTLALVACGAVVRGLLMGGGAAVLLHGPSQVAFRIVASVMTLVPLVLVTAAVVNDVRAEAERRAALAAARRAVDDAERAADAEIVDAHAATVARVREVLEQAVRGTVVPDVAARLREQIDAVIRPISHQLVTSVPQWTTDAQVEPARVRWRELWREATLGRPFQPGLTAALGFVVGIVGVSNRVGPAAGLAVTLLLAAATLLAFTVARRVWAVVLRRHPGPVRRVVLWAIITLGALVAVAGAVAGAFLAIGVDALPIVAAIITFGLAVTAAIACMQAAVANLREVTADLAAETVALERAVARVQAVAWQQQRVLALAIHGSLQAHVAAAAARLEAAIANGGDVSAAIAEARQSVLDALDQLDVGTVGSGDVREDLLDIAEAWEGVCDVVIQVDPAVAERIDADPAAARVVVDVCTEACSNAVRHADATLISVAVDELADALRIVVWSNGSPTGTRSEGLGTRLLDEVALRWERTVGDDQTSLEVVLPSVGAHAPRPVAVP